MAIIINNYRDIIITFHLDVLEVKNVLLTYICMKLTLKFLIVQ
jgi:hypothetical protein